MDVSRDVTSSRKRRPPTQSTIPEANSSKRQRGEAASDSWRRAGTITYMLLRNFMCHSYLEVKFEHNVTIIIGKNGSGKSAILTALIVGLGGKANLTNRGTSIKGFIKTGKNSGSIEIQFYNEGPMAYRPAVYGKRITVIRNFTASGTSQYKIKAESGEIISTKATEVKLITTGLNIQVDNPVCVLTQDTSRNFLNSNDPKHKFTLFMRATRLETLNEEYKVFYTNKRHVQTLLEEKSEALKKMYEETQKLKRKVDSHKSVATLREKLNFLNLELLWSKVKDSEIELQKQALSVQTLQKKHDEILDSKKKNVDELHDIQEKINDIERNITELKNSMSGQSQPLKDIEKMLERLRQQLNEKRKEKQLIQQTIAAKMRDIDELTKQITNANENMCRIEKGRVERLRKVSDMEQKIRGIDDHLETARNDLFQLRNDLARKEDEDQNLTREISRLDHDIANEVNNLNALRNESGNTLLLYGRNMPNILKAIEQCKGRFKHLPKGPLGLFINLKDKKWAVAVEGFIRPGLLSAFTVDNSKDSELLVQIFNKCCPDGNKPSIITSKFLFKKHNVYDNLVQAPRGCISLYNAIEVEDPVVSNCLVDQLSIEGILLIPSDQIAMELLSYANKVPRKCSQGITMKGDRYYPDPNYRTYASTYHKARYLQVDTSEYISQLETKIEQSKEQKKVIMRQQESFRSDMQQKLQRRNQLELQITKLKSARTQVKRQLEELRATAEPELANVQALESELNEIKNIIQEKNALLGSIDENIESIKKEISETDLKSNKYKKIVSDFEARLVPLQGKVRSYVARQREISAQDVNNDRKISELQGRLNSARAEKVSTQAVVDVRITEATAVGARPEQIRDVPDILSCIKENESAARQIETEADNIEEVIQKYNMLNEKSKKTSTIMASLKYNFDELTKAALLRTRHYKLTEDYFVTYIKHSFKKIMQLRQFKGSISVNMESKSLDMVVIPQQGSQGLISTSNLSGGERSFSTVAFLYSLWQCMQFPFYVLDEFDVYMDKLNRTKVIDILLSHAESNPQLQFVFLTPQDVSFIDKSISILRMPDPERFNV